MKETKNTNKWKNIVFIGQKNITMSIPLKAIYKTINKMKKTPMEWQKIFANHTFDRG